MSIKLKKSRAFKASKKYITINYNEKCIIKDIKMCLNNDYNNMSIILIFNLFEYTYSDIDKILKKIKIAQNLIKKSNKNLDVNCIVKCKNKEYRYVIKTAVENMNFHTKKEKYNHLYDCICYYLDAVVIGNNVCGFKDDKCIAKRDSEIKMGCCHHFKNRRFGILYEKNPVLCEYQKDKKCIAKCITCKMYMCDYLKKKGYNFNVQNVLLIKRYFNIFQKCIIMTSFFTTKEKIMKRLMFFSFK